MTVGRDSRAQMGSGRKKGRSAGVSGRETTSCKFHDSACTDASSRRVREINPIMAHVRICNRRRNKRKSADGKRKKGAAGNAFALFCYVPFYFPYRNQRSLRIGIATQKYSVILIISMIIIVFHERLLGAI